MAPMCQAMPITYVIPGVQSIPTTYSSYSYAPIQQSVQIITPPTTMTVCGPRLSSQQQVQQNLSDATCMKPVVLNHGQYQCATVCDSLISILATKNHNILSKN